MRPANIFREKPRKGRLKIYLAHGYLGTVIHQLSMYETIRSWTFKIGTCTLVSRYFYDMKQFQEAPHFIAFKPFNPYLANVKNMASSQ
jgi:hypothetical protein